MARSAPPVTPGIRFLRDRGVEFEPRLYTYVDHGGTREAAKQLGLPESAVVKTLVMQDEGGRLFLVLMPGDREVSTRRLARRLGVKRVSPAPPAAAERVTGYRVGGISPFGTRTPLSVYVEADVFRLGRIYLNAGKRGFLVGIDPEALRRTLMAEAVQASAGS